MILARAAALTWAIGWMLLLLLWPRIVPNGSEHGTLSLLLIAICLAFASGLGLRMQRGRQLLHPLTALAVLTVATVGMFI